MGSFDGAETCELVVLFILSKLQDINKTIGIYRDDGILTTRSSPRQTQKLAEQISNIFKDHGLKITANANLKIVDFLEVTLDLNTGLYKPFTKPNNTIQYVHSKSITSTFIK